MKPKRIFITLGDPAGIGPEVVDGALAGWNVPDGITIELHGDRSAGIPGKPDERSAAAALDSLQIAARKLRDGEVDAVVTAPVCKESLQKIGFGYPGQSEFFADALNVDDFAMLLTGERLTVGLATIHEPLARVPDLLTVTGIMRVGKLMADFLRRRDISRPRIAVTGLNPHAGEGGAFGDEEERMIAPAIEGLNATRLADFSGPHVPDAIFRDAAQGRHDAVLAMYHDQGLIPLKLLDFDSAVNVTLGLPRPRTSPDHGTAFGIAGKGIADPRSMRAAIRLACELVSGRALP
jgi:4-hydroxythreonine-4-phosphate dehydrogenase